MELNDFVRETLLSIINGVKEAQEASSGTGAIISPSGLRYNTQLLRDQGYTEAGEVTQTIAFDLAVTVKKGKATQGKIGVLSGVLNLASQGQSSRQNDQTNRVQFTIPLLLPPCDPEKYRE